MKKIFAAAGVWLALTCAAVAQSPYFQGAMVPSPAPFTGFALIAKSGVTSAVTGTASETTLATITIPPNTLGANGQIKINAYWSATVSANTKTIRARLGGLAGSIIMSEAYANLTAANIWSSSLLFDQNATNAQTTASEFSRGDGLVTTVFLTTAVDMTQSQSLVLTGQLVTTTENVTLLGYTVEVAN
jgi:hypothetical protein